MASGQPLPLGCQWSSCMSTVQLCVAWPNDVIWPVAFLLDGVFGQKGAGS